LQGLTVRLEEGRIKVARILMDSVVDRQGLVQTGDIILQANGKDVKNPEELQKAIEESGEFIVFKIRPVEPDEDEDESAPAKAAKPKVS
jgi:S1-C subfamily serine protease